METDVTIQWLPNVLKGIFARLDKVYAAANVTSTSVCILVSTDICVRSGRNFATDNAIILLLKHVLVVDG